MATAPHTHPAPAWRLWLWGAVIGLLLLPLAAMQFTREVAWTVGDFLAAAALLGSAAAAFEWAMLHIQRPFRRTVAGLGILAVLMIVWLQLAIGII